MSRPLQAGLWQLPNHAGTTLTSTFIHRTHTRPRAQSSPPSRSQVSFAVAGLATAQGPRFQSRMAVNMKRLWGRILQGLLAILVVLYLGDWITLRVRTGAQGTNSVQVEQFLRTPLKGQKEEFDYMGTVAEPCVPALFPHRSEAPCWWVERHKIQWVSP